MPRLSRVTLADISSQLVGVVLGSALRPVQVLATFVFFYHLVRFLVSDSTETVIAFIPQNHLCQLREIYLNARTDTRIFKT